MSYLYEARNAETGLYCTFETVAKYFPGDIIELWNGYKFVVMWER